MKKLLSVISIILTAAVIFTVFAAVPFTVSAETKPSFVADAVEAEPGAKNVAVNISVLNNPGVASILLDIDYDKTALTLRGFEYNTTALAGTMTVPFNANAKRYSLSMVSGTKNIDGDFVLATLYFDVADSADGSYPINLSFDENNVYDINEDNVGFSVSGGSITVSGAAGRVIGDVNEDETIDILDALMIQKIAVDKVTPTDDQVYSADVNDDGTVDILDATMIQKLTVDKTKEFKKKA